MATVCGWEMAVAMHNLGGVGFIHRFMTIDQQFEEVKKYKKEVELYMTGMTLDSHWPDKYPVCAAIGVHAEDRVRAMELVRAGVNILYIDVAHGHHVYVKTMLRWLKEKFPDVDVIAGTIATADAAEELIEWGADALHVGIGQGSVCETRIRTGVGIPTVDSLIEVADVASVHGIPVACNGGISIPGNVGKALVAGADTVIIGSVFSGTTESPGQFKEIGIWPNNKFFKEYAGSASKPKGKNRHIEGNSKIVESKGSVERLVQDLTEGLQSTMSYVGAHNIEELKKNGKFIRVTGAGQVESKPHLLYQ
jgi:IMP dehydrogenase